MTYEDAIQAVKDEIHATGDVTDRAVEIAQSVQMSRAAFNACVQYGQYHYKFDHCIPQTARDGVYRSGRA